MHPLLVAVGSFVLYLVAYHTYGRWLSRRLLGIDPDRTAPSREFEDGQDYVPTNKWVVFGHHFTSIAGTGPIVGPAIAVLWGWVPALLWVIFGSILIGAVHDLSSLVVSLRNQGRSVGEIAGRLIGQRARLIFLGVLFLALTIVLAVFGLVIAAVFKQFPAAILPCLLQIPLAVLIGVLIHRRRGGLFVPSLVVLFLMYVTVFFGDAGILHRFNEALAGWSILEWVVALLVYAYIASVLPIWALLQPRDFINGMQLLTALALVAVGLVVAALIGGAPVVAGGGRPVLEFVAPAFRPDGGPAALFPFLFITVACGAVSGFHCLVSSGTSSKQLDRVEDARFIGFGSMLTEGFLAVIVILACAAGLGLGIEATDGSVLVGAAAWESKYALGGAMRLSAQVSAFVNGSANFLEALALPKGFASALMGVFVASFAATTMDSACRLQRYVIHELGAALFGAARRERAPGREIAARILENRHGATAIAVITAGVLAALPGAGEPWTLANAGKGGLLLWPLFGAMNQLLGGLAFVVIAFWMWRRSAPVWFVVIPGIFMLLLPAYAMAYQMFVCAVGSDRSWLASGNWLLFGIGFATLLLEVLMLAEAAKIWPRVRGELEPTAQAASPVSAVASLP